MIRYFSVPIVKVEKSPDGGSLFVYGKATDDSLDMDEQIIDKDFARKALGDWFAEYANVRQMHAGGLPPAGVGMELDEKPDGFWLKSEVYEPGAMLQVNKGGFKAYSVGIAQPRIVRDVKAKNGRIVGGKVVEVSLVDYPANPNCKFAITAKAAGDPTNPMEMLFKMVGLEKKGGPPAFIQDKIDAKGQDGDKADGDPPVATEAVPDVKKKPKKVKTATKAAGAVHPMQVAHDLLCPAYSSESLKRAYPDELEGVDWEHHDLAHFEFLAINKDILGGGGPAIPVPGNPRVGFGSATGTIGGSVDQLPGTEHGDGILPNSSPEPSAEGAGQPSPGQFRRPYLSAGHARMTGSGASASPSKPAGAGDGGVTITSHDPATGGARPSPGNSKRAPGDPFQQIHDSLVMQFPNIGCCMEPPTPGPAPKVTADPEIKKSKKERKAIKKAAKLQKEVGVLKSTVADLTKTVEDMSHEPDPRQSAHRREPLHKGLPEPEVQKREGIEKAQKLEKRARLEHQATWAPDADARLRAQQQIRDLDKAEEELVRP